MVSGQDDSDAIEIMKGQLELILKRLDSAEAKIASIMKKADENGKMLTSIMETMQQMGLVTQPYRKSDNKSGAGDDRAYW
jgi:predicted transcriptional regulator